jgi:RES domain-containing protein
MQSANSSPRTAQAPLFVPVRIRRLWLWRVALEPEVWVPGDRPARWSEADDPILYASSTAGLAVLEALAHLKASDSRRVHRLARIDARVGPADVLALDVRALPKRWPQRVAATRRIAQQWLSSKRSTALLVPSTLVAGEMNVLIDARSARWARWRNASLVTPHRFDARIR